MKKRKQPAMPAGLPWRFRGLQMDLARHMETVPYICRHADEAARDGFNALVLYLEGRVRTPSFPYRSPAASYSLEDMAQVAAHAQKLGLDLIPVVATLGHCQHFLACEALAHLAETRDGRSRFGGPTHSAVICPSQEETYVFLDAYLSELATVFPGPNLHVGLDEAWDLGACDCCRKRWEAEGLAALFMAHLARIHDIVKRLGRRLWMWDDFFELFPEQIEALPKDIVLCHWSYDNGIETAGIQAHFTNRRRRDWLAHYERLGLNVVICPWDRNPRNIEAFTDYARRHRVLGGLLTEWEGSPRFWPGQHAVRAFTGALWRGHSHTPETVWDRRMRHLLPDVSIGLRNAVIAWLRTGGAPAGANLKAFPAGPPAEVEAAQHAQAVLTCGLLGSSRAPAADAPEILVQIRWGAERARLLWALRVLVPAILSPRRPCGDVPDLRRRLRAWQRDYRRLLRYVPDVFLRRPEQAHADDAGILEAWRSPLDCVPTLMAALDRSPGRHDWILVMRLFLLDCHGAPRLRVTVRSADAEQVIADGAFKPPAAVGNATGGHYGICVPFVMDASPDYIELEAWGYGGQGVAYLDLQNASEIRRPVAIMHVRGPVTQPEAILKDDSSIAMLGSTDVLAQIHQPQLAEQRGVLVLNCKAVLD